MRVPVVIAALAALISLAGASSAPAHSPHGTGTFFQLRPDQRLCPSPACGGWFASRVNRATTACPGGAPAHACYVAELELGLLRLTSSERAAFERALRAGRVLVRGRIMPAPGRERVRELLVLEGWVAQGAGKLRSPVRRIEDNGIRCVTEPCFSLHASVLNAVGVHEDVSGIDLDGTGAPRAVIEQALSSLSTTSILVTGPTVTADDGGRTIVADRLWLRTTRPPER